MYSTKMHRLSGPSVVIGYILLIPSLIGILAAIGVIVLSVFNAGNVPSATADDAKIQLADAGIDPELATKITDIQVTMDSPEIERLTDEQKAIVNEVQTAIVFGGAGAAIGVAAIVGIAIAFALACFISGLIGWLLTMKKKVLQCSACRAVVGAS